MCETEKASRREGKDKLKTMREKEGQVKQLTMKQKITKVRQNKITARMSEQAGTKYESLCCGNITQQN